MSANHTAVLKKYIWDSTTTSAGQRECWKNIRRFIMEKSGKNSPLILAIDLLYHPKTSYHERLFKKQSDYLAGLELFEMWELAEEANLAGDLHKDEKPCFIPPGYFFDLKFFFLDLMLLKFFLEKPAIILVSEIVKSDISITLKKNGISMMLSKEEQLLLINLEKGNVTFFEDLRRGMHLPIDKLDPLVLEKLRAFGLKI